MPRRPKTELIAEFHRVYDDFEALLNCMAPLWEPSEHEQMLRLVTKREQVLSLLSSGKATAAEIVQGAKQGLNDLVEGIPEALTEEPEATRVVIQCFNQKTGRNLLEIVKSTQRLTKQIVQRGKIKNDTEFYLLNEVMSQVDQSIFQEPQTTLANELLEQYEIKTSR